MKKILLAVFAAAMAFSQTTPVKVSPDIMADRLVTRVRPRYPVEAKRAWIQGTVSLDVTIDSSGHVTEAKSITGPTQLTQSAIDAVKQWIYKPLMVQGEAVAVQTTVEVYYTLGSY